MTDRIHSLTVVLDRDYRDDDVQAVVDAIKLLRCVTSVGLNVSDAVSYMAEERALEDWRGKIRNLLWPKL